MNKVVSVDCALSSLKSGMTVMIGGNMGSGTPEWLANCLLQRNIEDLTIITSDISFPECGIARLIGEGKVKQVITSHIGNFPIINALAKNGKVELIIIPRGTLTQYIRVSRVALGGSSASLKAATAVFQEQKLIRIDGRSYSLQVPFKAEVALIKAHKSDNMGNLLYRREARNYNPIMAAAAEVVIAEIDVVVDNGVIDKDEILTAGAFVKYVVMGQPNY